MSNELRVWADEKIVGKIHNGIFTKLAYESKHMLKRPKAWCFDISSIDNYLNEFHTIKIKTLDTNTTYIVDKNVFLQFKGELDRGFGKQYFLTLNHWELESEQKTKDKIDGVSPKQIAMDI